MRLRRLTRWVAQRFPRPAVEALRSVARGWGRATAGLRLRPGVIVVGAQRCGTTTLYRVLSEHPDLVRPTFSKGIFFFDLNYERGERWYRGHFPIAAIARRRVPGPAPVAFESSGYYSFHPLAAGRIGRDLPGVRIILMVRDPVERAYSAYKHELARGFETESFERALELESERLDGEVERMIADPGYESFDHRHHAYVTRGCYAEQVERLQAAVGADHVYVMDADDFFADPVAQVAELFDWLGLTPWTPSEVQQWNARPGDGLTPELRERLRERFAPHDERLAELTGRTPSWRR
jgi:hypothetical protein